MKMKSLGRLVCSVLVASTAALPALALDYEAKPVGWVLMAPIRLTGGLVGGTFSGLVSGPIDHSYHDSLKGTTQVAGQFGDENGGLQRVVAAPTGGLVGGGVGTVVGGPKGFCHGFSLGWNHPLSRWSFITMEEK
jgi:hypothetical protein